MEIEVGDRVTYRTYIGDMPTTRTQIITTTQEACANNGATEDAIIKIERIGEKGWYVVEKKKELLTEEEKEFLNFFSKYYDIDYITFNEYDMDIYEKINKYICCPDYPKNLKFKGVAKARKYTLKELGLED